MIKITKNENGLACYCCLSTHDIYNIKLGRDERKTNTIQLCPTCRKQLSNMLTKRVK